MLPHQTLEFRHKVLVAAEGELRLDAAADGREAQLIEPRGLRPQCRLRGQVLHGRTAPDAERRIEKPDRRLRIAF